MTEEKQEVLENYEEGSPAEEEVSQTEETSEEALAQEEVSEVTLDDLDQKAPKEKFRIITDEDVLPEVMTIVNVKLGKAKTINDKGEFIAPEVNGKGGKYYKAKAILELAETINGDAIRTFVPSIFYSVDDEGKVALIPTVPNACSDEKLGHKFTSEIAELRNKYCKAKGVDPKEVSSASFLKGLIGMKFKPGTESDEYKGKTWIKLVVEDFIQ